jgi:hypothetical protein
MYNPESRYIESLTLDQAERKAQAFLRAEAINMDDRKFRDFYHDQVVNEDKAYVEKMERTFENEATPDTKNRLKLATIFEAIIHENAELSDWFGPDAHTFKSSRYDDIKNGVDSIVELREPKENSTSHLALGIDATISVDLDKKFERIRKEIEHGELSHVKYFFSEYTDLQEKPLEIPRVVIGADAKTIKGLAEMWLEGKKRDLGTHPIQFQILEEIMEQLDAFQEYATRMQKPHIAEAYERTKKLITMISGAKRSTMADSSDRDDVFYAIVDHARSFRSFPPSH